jgi:hypothetical protein
MAMAAAEAAAGMAVLEHTQMVLAMMIKVAVVVQAMYIQKKLHLIIQQVVY